jgi:type VI secretion system (T6SS) phospholipase Tle1-like effector
LITSAKRLLQHNPTFKQFFFAGNHSDVGGSYAEVESRLSDIVLAWMLEEAVSVPDGLRVGPAYVNGAKVTGTGDQGAALHLHPADNGVQHSEITATRDYLDAIKPKTSFCRSTFWPHRGTATRGLWALSARGSSERHCFCAWLPTDRRPWGHHHQHRRYNTMNKHWSSMTGLSRNALSSFHQGTDPMFHRNVENGNFNTSTPVHSLLD